MRKAIIFFISFLISTSVLFTQTVIENPKKPLNKNAGRILKLKEVLRIKDIESKFYFKSPSNLKVAHDGSIFIRDFEQLLKFSSDGKFIKNLFKKGRGPGEISSNFAYSYTIDKDETLIYGDGKTIRFDLGGNLIKESRLKATLGSFKGVMDNWLIFSSQIWPPQEERTSKLCKLKNIIKLVSKDGEIEKKIHDFPTKIFLGPQSAMSWSSLRWVLSHDNKQLFASHTREYKIKLLDLEKGKVIISFKRKYRRVKYVMKEWEKKFYKKINPPKKKYESDILDLTIYKGLLWVKTSTKDKKKGILIDVFNSEGKYIDNFYLDFDGTLMTTHGDSIFVKETGEEENIQIVEYKIIE